MTIYYSKCGLNTYRSTPYFQAHIPVDYPGDAVLLNTRAFRRLPARLRELSALAKRWAIRKHPEIPGGMWDVKDLYDVEGYELDPDTERRLTDEEIDAGWVRYGPRDPRLVQDIPLPPGGFADPDTWEEPAPVEDREVDPDAPTEESLLRDIKSHGREYVARDYGVPIKQNDRELAHSIFVKIRGGSVVGAPGAIPSPSRPPSAGA